MATRLAQRVALSILSATFREAAMKRFLLCSLPPFYSILPVLICIVGYRV